MTNNFKRNNYTGYHEFSCLHCEHIIKPETWPDVRKNIRCSKNSIRLDFLINDDGYCVHDEWFCKDILNEKFPDFHKNEFNAIKDTLKPEHMYLLCGDYIKEVSFKVLGLNPRVGK